MTSRSHGPDDGASMGEEGQGGSVGFQPSSRPSTAIIEAAPSAALRVSDIERIHEVLDEGDGFWRPCSGCYETNEGYDVGPRSPAFKSHMGSGCPECGGLGVIWDSTDYADMARFILADEAAERDRNAVTEELVGALYRLWIATAVGTDAQRVGAMTVAGDLLARIGALDVEPKADTAERQPSPREEPPIPQPLTSAPDTDVMKGRG